MFSLLFSVIFKNIYFIYWSQMCLILGLSFPPPHVIIITTIIIIVVVINRIILNSVVYPYKQRQGALLILTS